MFRIPALVALPDQLERMAREIEGPNASADQIRLIEELREHAFALAENIEASRMLAADAQCENVGRHFTGAGVPPRFTLVN